MRFLLTKLSHFFIFFLGLSVTAPFVYAIHSSVKLPETDRSKTFCVLTAALYFCAKIVRVYQLSDEKSLANILNRTII